MSYNKKFIKLIVLGGSPQKAEHIRLRIGEYKRNPHVRVLCPDLRKGYRCYRHHRPKLLLKNHANPRLQLWECEGIKRCATKPFLIRVQYEED